LVGSAASRRGVGPLIGLRRRRAGGPEPSVFFSSRPGGRDISPPHGHFGGLGLDGLRVKMQDGRALHGLHHRPGAASTRAQLGRRQQVHPITASGRCRLHGGVEGKVRGPPKGAGNQGDEEEREAALGRSPRLGDERVDGAVRPVGAPGGERFIGLLYAPSRRFQPQDELVR